MGFGCCVLTGQGSSKISAGPAMAPFAVGSRGYVSAGASRGWVSGPAAPAIPISIPKKLSPVQAAKAATPRAIEWTKAALAHLKDLKSTVKFSGRAFALPGAFDIVNTHFHLDRDLGFPVRQPG